MNGPHYQKPWLIGTITKGGDFFRGPVRTMQASFLKSLGDSNRPCLCLCIETSSPIQKYDSVYIFRAHLAEEGTASLEIWPRPWRINCEKTINYFQFLPCAFVMHYRQVYNILCHLQWGFRPLSASKRYFLCFSQTLFHSLLPDVFLDVCILQSVSITWTRQANEFKYGSL
jgi:hypothetical protein